MKWCIKAISAIRTYVCFRDILLLMSPIFMPTFKDILLDFRKGLSSNCADIWPLNDTAAIAVTLSPNVSECIHYLFEVVHFILANYKTKLINGKKES